MSGDIKSQLFIFQWFGSNYKIRKILYKRKEGYEELIT